MAIVGLTFTLAREGARKNIFLNCIAPNAYTAMTQGIIPDDYKSVGVKDITPVVQFLAHEKCTRTGKIYECGGGWVSETKFV